MTGQLIARWLVEYARRPLNLVLLVAVPVIYVTLSAGALADFADILGGPAGLGDVEVATAGWAAAVLSGIATFFHVSSSRDADRRLAAAHGRAGAVVTSRLASSLVLAGLATVGALVALAARTEIGVTTPKVIGTTMLSAVIYAGIGATVGCLVRSDMNGSLTVVFLWIFDVFFGPAMGGTATALRVLPLHFPTLIITDVALGHAGGPGDLGWSLVWAATSMTVAVVSLTLTTRPRPRTLPPVEGPRRRITVGLSAASRQLRRMPTMWILIIGLPLLFIGASKAVTPEAPTPVETTEDGRRTMQILSMADVHGAVMVSITVGFLASLIGLFVILDSADADRRLALTGYCSAEIVTIRLAVIAIASLVATAVALGVTAVGFEAANWPVFVAANVIVALTYATIGVIVGPLFGRIGGMYLLLVLPFVDVGLAQNAMFDAAPPAWGRFLPAHGAVRVMMDGAFTTTFDESWPLLLAAVWLITLTAVAVAVFRHNTITGHEGRH